MSEDRLALDNVGAGGEGGALSLRGITLRLGAGRSLAVLGRNGAGKSTLIATIIGLVPLARGRVMFEGRDVSRLPADERARLGMGWVPQGRAIFPSLTVEENLTAVARPGSWDERRIFDLFPRLKEHRRQPAAELGGGERRMLAIGRALVVNPRLLLLDEPTEGLAPVLIDEIFASLRRLMFYEKMSVILAGQHVGKALALTDDAVILDAGAITFAAPSRALAEDAETLKQALGISPEAAR